MALPVAELVGGNYLAKAAAANAIADAVEAGTILDAEAAAAVVELLGDRDRATAQLAQFILQTDAERDLRGSASTTALQLGIADSASAPAIRRGAAKVLAGCLARADDGAQVAELLADADAGVRAGALSAIADGAVPRAELAPVVAAVVPMLADASPAVKKDAIWVAYLLASEGGDIAEAVPALEGALADASTAGNAAIGLALAWERAGDPRAAALRTHALGIVQFGAAWGRADDAMARGDLAQIKAMYTDEDATVRRGLGAFMHEARQRGRDISLGGRAFAELEAELTDALLQARIYAVRELVSKGADA